MLHLNQHFGNRDRLGSRTSPSAQSTQSLDRHQRQKWKPKSLGKCSTKRRPNQSQTSSTNSSNTTVSAWIKRFIHNCKHKEKKLGPLLTEEIDDVRSWWIKRVQRRDRETTGYPQISGQLNLKPNEEGVMTCHGRIQGQTPIYLPNSASFTGKLVQQVHCATLHGGVALTMAAVRERYWIPKLRQIGPK